MLWNGKHITSKTFLIKNTYDVRCPYKCDIENFCQNFFHSNETVGQYLVKLPHT